ncbi:hypothetical protein [Anabaena sp. PCC 7108]|uniref:hypothetical protein n=1 Tax=Anabaena sp. PCC 7108 TaxID=163908 RepID=UPI00034A6582|nr:hypothetical protein [Anabaena sp. PCC 7108]
MSSETENTSSDNNNEKLAAIEANFGIGFGFGIISNEWVYYSLYHIYAAFYFANLSKHIEQVYQNERATRQPQDRIIILDKYFKQHRACVTSAIFSSVAFLEATINELFAEIVEFPNGYYAKQLDYNTKSQIKILWKIDVQNPSAKEAISYNLIENKRTLEKFQMVLSIAEKDALEQDSSPYQDINELIKIRNVLMHYKPQMIVRSSSIESIPITKKFNGLNFHALESANKFIQNPLLEGGNAYFPDRCLGHGCAQWAADSSLKFVKLFYNKLGVEPNPGIDTYTNSANVTGIVFP